MEGPDPPGGVGSKNVGGKGASGISRLLVVAQLHSALGADNPCYATHCAGITSLQNTPPTFSNDGLFNVPRSSISDVTMSSQLFDAIACSAKENYSIHIPIILGIQSFKPATKTSW